MHDDKLDLIFVSETCLGTDALPQLEGYQVIANPKVETCLHGGIACYVKKLSFKPCYSANIWQVIYILMF